MAICCAGEGLVAGDSLRRGVERGVGGEAVVAAAAAAAAAAADARSCLVKSSTRVSMITSRIDHCVWVTEGSVTGHPDIRG